MKLSIVSIKKYVVRKRKNMGLQAIKTYYFYNIYNESEIVH